MTDTLLDSYSETNADQGFVSLSNWNAVYSAVGQSFKTPNDGISYILTIAKFLLAKSAGATGNIRVDIYAHTGVFGTSSLPTGGILASSDDVDASTLNLTTPALYTFTFSGANQITLTPNTSYCIMVKGITLADGTVNMPYDNSVPTHQGNRFYWVGAWDYTTKDMPFYVYGEPIQFTLTITATDNVTTSPTEGAHDYIMNTDVPVTATVDAHYYLSDWLLDSVSQGVTTNPFTVTMDADHELTPVISLQKVLTITCGSGGTLDKATGYYNTGTPVTVTATAAERHHFFKWTLDGLPKGYISPIIVTMNTDHSLTAQFQKLSSLFQDIIRQVER